MIAKVETKKGKSFAGFAKLDAYIERFEAAHVIRRSPNLEPNTPVPEQMDATASQGTGRVRNPAYHYVLSWDRDAIPQKQIWEAVEKSLVALGCQDHQWVAAQHIDTTHDHAHVLVNRIHPETHRAWIQAFDYSKLTKLCNELDPRRPETTNENRISGGASDHEAWSGQQSMQTWGRAAPLPDLANVLKHSRPTWKRLHAALAEHGALYEVKDGVGYIADHSMRRPHFVRASAVDAALKLEALEAHLGPYSAAAFYVVPNRDKAYGSQLAKWNLPTLQMQNPLVRPLYDRFIVEQITWQTTGRYAAREERRLLTAAIRDERVARKEDAIEAMRMLDSMTGIERDTARFILKTLIDADEIKRREAQRAQRDLVAGLRPNEMFRRWLKERVADGDFAAGVAMSELRKPIIQIPQAVLLGAASSPTLGVTTMDKITVRPLVGNDLVLHGRLARAIIGCPAIENHSDKILAIAEDAMNEMRNTPKFREEFRQLETALEKMPGFASVDVELAQHAILAVAGVSYLSELDVRALYEPLEVATPYVGYGPAFEAKLAPPEAHEEYTEVSDTRPIDEQVLKGRALGNDDDIIGGDGNPLDGGSIQAGSGVVVDLEQFRKTAAQTETQSLALQKYAEGYDEYVKSVGNGLYGAQKSLYMERKRAIDQEYSVRKAATKELEPPDLYKERSKALGWKLRTESFLDGAYRIEDSILEDCSGVEPPKSLRQYLLDLKTPESIELAAVVEEQTPKLLVRDRPPISAASAVAAKLTWTDLEGGSVQYNLDGRQAFVDKGRSIDVRSSRDKEAATAALLMASAKFGGSIQLDGSDSYKRIMIRRAVELKISISNPELQDLQKSYAKEYALKQAQDAPKPAAASTEAETAALNANRKRIDDIFSDPTLSNATRRDKVDAIVAASAIAQIAIAKNAPVTMAANGLTIDGKLDDVIVFNRHAYAVVSGSNPTKKKALVLVPFNPETAKHLAYTIGSEVRAEATGIGNTYDLDTDHVKQMQTFGRGAR